MTRAPFSSKIAISSRFGVLRNDFVLLAIESTPFPTAPTKWTYRAIYMLGDAMVGRWSNPVTVGG